MSTKIFVHRPLKRAEIRRRNGQPPAVAIVPVIAAPRPESDPMKTERSAARAEERRIMRGLIAEARATHPAPKKENPPPPEPTRMEFATFKFNAKGDLTVGAVKVHASRGLERFLRSKRKSKFVNEMSDLYRRN
jgi:hypothetical protein